MRRGWMWMGLGLVLGLGGWAVLGAELDPEVRKLMEKYERQAAPPAPKPAPAPKPKPKPKPPPVEVESAPALKPGLAPELVRISGGCFQMGSPENEPDRGDGERRHRVCVEAFEMGRYEVTQRQWQAVMGNNPSSFKGCADCPVEEVIPIPDRFYISHVGRVSEA